MNLALRLFAGVIDLLQFIFFITFLAFQFMTPVGGGISGAAAGAYFCYNASSGVISGVLNAAACAATGGVAGGILSAIATPVGIAIDIALSCTFGILLILMLWVSGRFSLMAVIMGFGSEMLPGINAFSPGWSLLVHRSIQQYKKVHTTATPRTTAFLKQAYSAAMPKLRDLSVTRADNRYANAGQSAREIIEHARTPLKQFDGIRRPANTPHEATA